MPVSRIVVLGASAGGVEALSRLLALLPPELPAAVVVVLHLAEAVPSVLPRILARATKLPVCAAAHDVPLEAGHVYVAPPDHHVVVAAGGRLELVRGPRENGSRPAIDPLFRSAGRVFGPAAAGVILSGTLGDGAHGLAVIKALGGTALVQSPDEALHDGMPRAAIAQGRVDHVLPIEGLARELVRFAARDQGNVMPVSAGATMDKAEAGNGARAHVPHVAHLPRVRDEVDLVGTNDGNGGIGENEALGGRIAPYSCPECSGTLWEIRDGLPVRFRCRVGHSYDEPTLLQHKDVALEAALWTALMALEENASLAERMAERATTGGRQLAALHYRDRLALLEARAHTIRSVLHTLPPTAAEIAYDELVEGTRAGALHAVDGSAA